MIKQDIKHTLALPIFRNDGSELKELVVTRPKIKDIRGVDLNNLGTNELVKLLKNLIKPALTEQEIDSLDLKDFKDIQEIITSFLQE